MNPATSTYAVLRKEQIGGKARPLQALAELGLPVPRWMVIPADELPDLQAGKDVVPGPFLDADRLKAIRTFFGPECSGMRFAVRSSALEEDGRTHSFAGLYHSVLEVPFDQLENRVAEVWEAARAARLDRYRAHMGLAPTRGLAIIIQEMVSADASGVAFGADPVSGVPGTIVVSAVWGLGEGLVNGSLDADTWRLSASARHARIVRKARKCMAQPHGGVAMVDVPEQLQHLPVLKEEHLDEMVEVLQLLEAHWGIPQDIEFAIQGDKIWYLQSRPVTARSQPAEDEAPVLWDNSNIAESYPGITLPLTFTFIRKMYSQVYRQFAALMGVPASVIAENKAVYDHTLGLVRGRVYYHLLHWYRMLALLPGYRMNAPFMEKMMGVRESLPPEVASHMPKGMAFLRVVWMALRMLLAQLTLPRDRRRFYQHVGGVWKKYQAMQFEGMAAEAIFREYQALEKQLLYKWKAPLVNDFFAMIWFGLLARMVASCRLPRPQLHNDLLCGSRDIHSVEMVRQFLGLIESIRRCPRATTLFLEGEQAAWLGLQNDPALLPLYKAVQNYLQTWGDRCSGEMQLETIPPSLNPIRLMADIRRALLHSPVDWNRNCDRQLIIRLEAEVELREALAGRPWRRAGIWLVLSKARQLVRERENLRVERTRAFGVVRRMFMALGRQWAEKGILRAPEDIHYLHLEEIEQGVQCPALQATFVDLVDSRKAAYARFRQLPAPASRILCRSGEEAYPEWDAVRQTAITREALQGQGCCPGRVHAAVKIVHQPEEVASLQGAILVARSTDPGWTTLFPSAAGILVERGSLLSHAAIVAREMGIPCIVSVPDLLDQLVDGQEVIMDGRTGEIIRL